MTETSKPERSAARIVSVALASVIASPFSVTSRALLLFCVCMVGVAQRQFPGPYPLFRLMRSSVVPGGRGPMSARKLANPLSPVHRLAMATPAAYSPESSRHRYRMELKELYSGVPDAPWMRLPPSQPQLVDCPSRNDDASTSFSVPHRQRHRQYVERYARGATPLPSTCQRPKVRPFKSIKAAICLRPIGGFDCSILPESKR